MQSYPLPELYRHQIDPLLVSEVEGVSINEKWRAAGRGSCDITILYVDMTGVTTTSITPDDGMPMWTMDSGHGTAYCSSDSRTKYNTQVYQYDCSASCCHNTNADLCMYQNRL